MNNTRRIRRLGTILMLGVGILMGGCATGGAGAGSQGNTTVEVENNLIPPTPLSVYIVPEIGTRRLIGQVQPGTTRVLRFNRPSAAGQFRFSAETSFGQEIVSNPVSFGNASAARWDVSANIALITDG